MDVKSFLHSWCMKQCKTPKFDVRPIGIKSRQRFLCEVRVDGYPYTGCGNSANKKDAQFNAARDFLQYLVRLKILRHSDVPHDTFNPFGISQEGSGNFPGDEQCQMKSVLSEADRPYKKEKSDDSYTYEDRIAEQTILQNTKEMDMNSEIHGNWTIENGKSRLHKFLQQNNIKAEYIYSITGSDNSKNFIAEMTIYIQKLNLTLRGRESGSNKLSASKSCALSLVRQLYHLGIIESFTGSLKSNRQKENEMKPYPVAISPELELQVLSLLREINIEPVKIDTSREFPKDEAISILNSTVLEGFIRTKSQKADVISWAPPLLNWNPWTSCNIDEGPLSYMNLDDISKKLELEQREMIQKNEFLQNIILERANLPVASCKKEILNTIYENSVCLIKGSTGCGKTTQICQFILDDYIQTSQGAYCNIIITQLKRLSAVSVAERVAYERGEQLGNSVGYNVRFESVKPRPYGSLLFCTVGTLLKKLDYGLRGVSHVIVDEIHERDVYTDFLLVILRDMIYTYSDLRVILMSATLDTNLFIKYFSNCPIIEIPGRLYPVQEYFLEDIVELLHFTPNFDPKKRKRNRSSSNKEDDEEKILQIGEKLDRNLNLIVDDSYSYETKKAMSMMNEKEINFNLIHKILIYIKGLNISGSILIFLPGWSIIYSLMTHLEKLPEFRRSDYAILLLHSCLPREEQKRVFETYPSYITKVILATNIAESSITINDVVYVIDSAKVNIKMFTTHNNLTQYATVWASKTNLQQRKGRAGRVRPGFCFHLCSKARYNHLEEHMTPEIFRTPLHELALAIKMLRLGAVDQFLSKAVEPPPIDAVIEAEVLLREMRCLDINDELTPLGKIIGQLPIEPKLGRMLIFGCLFQCANPLATIAASCNTFPEVFISSNDGRGLTFQQKGFAGNRYSDHAAMLNAFQAWENARRNRNEMGYCEAKMLSESTLRITSDAKDQLINLLFNSCGFPEECLMDHIFSCHELDMKLDLILGFLCIGLYPNVAYHKSKRRVITAGNKIALINKKSVNYSNLDQTFPLPFFVYGEKIRTRAITCKQLTMVTPLHLLLFGARKVEFVNGIVRLDNWINLQMKPQVASAIVALRPALESLVAEAAKDPQNIRKLSRTDEKVINLVKELCKINAARYGMEQVELSTFSSLRPQYDNFSQPNEAKRIRSDFRPFRKKGINRHNFNNRLFFRRGRGGRNNFQCETSHRRFGRSRGRSFHTFQ